MSHKPSSASTLSPTTLPGWNPSNPPLYDIHKSYLENSEFGPFFHGSIPERKWAPKSDWIDFLGFRVASPLGIPAGPLLNSRWTHLASKLGFDVLCYKTIRSFEFAGHPVPNVIFVDSKKQLNPAHLPPCVYKQDHPSQCLDELSITNSFGMPSRSPSFLRRDIPLAISQLQEGQILIVSVVGTPPKSNESYSFADDFVAAAKLAKECGAPIIEANFSCPNVKTGEGCVYYNPETVFEISSKIVKAIGDTPLVIKVGLFPTKELMEKSFHAAAKGGVRGISGINTISMKVLDKDNQPALGADRLTSGICGASIREAAIEFMRQAKAINDRHKFGFALIGTGGVMLPQHFTELLKAGADIVMSGTAMMWDPFLALRYLESKYN
jgi:dihydroorotate dehydrogenase (NAD+) catalytic subunit